MSKLRTKLLLACLLSFFAWFVVRRVQKAAKLARDTAEVVEFAKDLNQLINHPPRNYREFEHWVPEDFFQSPTALQACNAISSRDNESIPIQG
ncbi:hypothetical protein CA13_40780 [Planctomycetes bacterium CA13]|uniref:Uncharacterized protein n=1 Tax=Novipirellula herctigrandis TaxID=2527986 RepID=A0A5C5Z5Z3_9BACT|nr:hypothetical protein CA13_40780 [Planctomycetes bacterium CA13]